MRSHSGEIKMYTKYFLALLFASLCSFSLSAHAWKIHSSFDEGGLGEKSDMGTDGFSTAAGRSLYSDEQKLKGQSVKLHVRK